MDLTYLSTPQRAQALQIIRKCAMSRVYFVENILKVEYIEPWQRKTLELLDSGTTKVSIRSGHGVGKTGLCAWLALHFLLFRDDVKVIVTSPSQKQLSDGLNPELIKWKNKLPDWMSASLSATAERITRAPSTANNFISFRTARKENPEALAGVHATHVLIIVDEASGVDEVIYETGQGALSTKGAIAVLIGNPTRPNGFFFKTQTSLGGLWYSAKVSCYDSSRVDEEYIKSVIQTYGVDSREYRVRVLGEFPDGGADSVIPRSWIESAVSREIAKIKGDRLWGVDPGRGGDATGFVERCGNAVLEFRELRTMDLMGIVGWVKNKWDMTPPEYRPKYICVDSIGMGAGVADRLVELGLPVVHVNVSESAPTSDRYMRLRDELWGRCREWFESMEVYISPNVGDDNEFAERLQKFIDELSGINFNDYTSDGKVNVESKKQMRARGVKSPNMGDALCLTFALTGAAQLGNYTDPEGWNSYDMSLFQTPNVF